MKVKSPENVVAEKLGSACQCWNTADEVGQNFSNKLTVGFNKM